MENRGKDVAMTHQDKRPAADGFSYVGIRQVTMGFYMFAFRGMSRLVRVAQAFAEPQRSGRAAHNFHAARGRLPSHGDRQTGVSAQARLLPYMEGQSLLNLVDQSVHWRLQTAATKNTPLPFLKCPSQELLQYTDVAASGTFTDSLLRCHYMVIMGAKPEVCVNPFSPPSYPQNTYTMINCIQNPDTDGGIATNGAMYFESKTSFKDFMDGSSNTMMFGELSWDAGLDMTWLCGNDQVDPANPFSTSWRIWSYNGKNVAQPINSAPYIPTWADRPSGFALHDVSFGSRHVGGCHVLMADASGHFLQENVDLVGVLKPMASRDSEEVYQKPF
jgi:hypothetical protein